METFGTTDITVVVTMWIQAKGKTCNVHGHTARFKSRLNGRMFVVQFTFFPAATL